MSMSVSFQMHLVIYKVVHSLMELFSTMFCVSAFSLSHTLLSSGDVRGLAAKGLTFLPVPSHPGSVSAVPAGTPPSSTLSTGPARLRCHSNRILFCTAGLIGPRVSPVAPSADS